MLSPSLRFSPMSQLNHLIPSRVAGIGLSALAIVLLGCGKQVQISDEEMGIHLTYDCGSFKPKVESADEMAALIKEQAKIMRYMSDNEHFTSISSLSNANSLRERERILVNYKFSHKEGIDTFRFKESKDDKDSPNKTDEREKTEINEEDNDEPIELNRKVEISEKSPIWETTKSVNILKWVNSQDDIKILDEVEKEWGEFYKVKHDGVIGYIDKDDVKIIISLE